MQAFLGILLEMDSRAGSEHPNGQNKCLQAQQPKAAYSREAWVFLDLGPKGTGVMMECPHAHPLVHPLEHISLWQADVPVQKYNLG